MRVVRVEFESLWIQHVAEGGPRIKHAAQSPTRTFVKFLTVTTREYRYRRRRIAVPGDVASQPRPSLLRLHGRRRAMGQHVAARGAVRIGRNCDRWLRSAAPTRSFGRHSFSGRHDGAASIAFGSLGSRAACSLVVGGAGGGPWPGAIAHRSIGWLPQPIGGQRSELGAAMSRNDHAKIPRHSRKQSQPAYLHYRKSAQRSECRSEPCGTAARTIWD